MTHLKAVMAFGVVALALCVTPVSVAAPPTNDNFANATVVTALPFSDTASIAEASQEAGEPTFWAMGLSVWYAFTPAQDAVLRANVSGMSYYVINAYRQDGSNLGGLTYLNGYIAGPVVFNVQAGSTYYIQAGSFNPAPVQWWETFNFSLESVPPPANDNFADAMTVSGGLPFTDTQDITGATIEPNEPNASECGGNFIRSVWYAFTPTASGSYGFSADHFRAAGAKVYTGASLQGLTQIACSGSSTGAGWFHGDVGTTYYIQSGTWLDSGSLAIRIDFLPPPSLGIFYGPSYPSTFDNISFQGQYYDPIGIDPNSWAWEFGDGATATGSNPQHQYTKDGDYNITVTASTPDGRSGSYSQILNIETHDVAMRWISTTSKGRVGRVAPIQVGINNMRYPESVQVDFYKSTPNGLQWIGALTNTVPVTNNKNKTTMFSLNYTFTSDDLAVGKLNFQAVATIQGDHPDIDAFPGDNSLISSPTTVTR